MKVVLVDRNSKSEVEANIVKAKKLSLPTARNGWKFNWKVIQQTTTVVYGIQYESCYQGLVALNWKNGMYFEMTHLELAPQNYGSEGVYDNIAGCLIAFACSISFEENSVGYKGFLTFKSKGSLLKHYQDKYGAKLIFRNQLVIDPDQAKLLIQKYLNKAL